MCFYCGCREIPLLRDYIAEHERVTDLGAMLSIALRQECLDTAHALLDRIGQDLESHWRGEEGGLFAEMRADETYRDYIDELVEEHRGLRDLLATADLAAVEDRNRVVAAMEGLYDHIAKEEDGLFPASLTSLSGEQWDRSIAAWQNAHASDEGAGHASANRDSW